MALRLRLQMCACVSSPLLHVALWMEGGGHQLPSPPSVLHPVLPLPPSTQRVPPLATSCPAILPPPSAANRSPIAVPRFPDVLSDHRKKKKIKFITLIRTRVESWFESEFEYSSNPAPGMSLGCAFRVN